jgi:hypothetical protein
VESFQAALAKLAKAQEHVVDIDQQIEALKERREAIQRGINKRAMRVEEILLEQACGEQPEDKFLELALRGAQVRRAAENLNPTNPKKHLEQLWGPLTAFSQALSDYAKSGAWRQSDHATLEESAEQADVS